MCTPDFASCPLTSFFHLLGKFITFARHGFEEHNNFRTLHHVAPLKWSDKLAIQAQKLAYKMALKGTIQVPGIDLFGENRARLSAVNFDCETAGEEATKIWYNQGSNYSFADPRLNSNTDSFTQVIWKGTRDVGMGCAQRKGTLSNDIFVVALYYPPGNSPRALRENVVSPNKNVNDAYSSIFRRRDELSKTKRTRILTREKERQKRKRRKRAWTLIPFSLPSAPEKAMVGRTPFAHAHRVTPLWEHIPV